MDLKKLYMRVYTGFIWFKMGSSGGLLWTQQCTFGFITMGVSWPDEWLLIEISGSHGSKYEDDCFLECCTM
jgi:hypothetical protein